MTERMENAVATMIEANARLTDAVTSLVKASMGASETMEQFAGMAKARMTPADRAFAAMEAMTADELNANAEAAMEAMAAAGEKAEDKPKRTRKAKAEPAKEPEVELEPGIDEDIVVLDDEPAEDEPTFTLVEVRAKLAGLSQAGKQAQVKALIESFGAAKLTEIDPAKYAAVMKQAEVL